MGFGGICAVLFLLSLLSTLYTIWDLSQKSRIIVDICAFLFMLVATIVLSFPANLLLIGLIFLLWVMLGNLIGYFYPRLWFWIENQYLKKQGIPCNQKIEKCDTKDDFICKLLYYTLEFGLIVVFIRAVIVNIIQ